MSTIKRTRMMFTPVEKQIISENKYTERVTDCTVYFTSQFKDVFVQKMRLGMSAREIFEDCGYSVKLLGISRIYGYSDRVKKSEKDKYKSLVYSLQNDLSRLTSQFEALSKMYGSI